MSFLPNGDFLCPPDEKIHQKVCVTPPFSLHHVGLPSCCPCQGTVGNDATVGSSEAGPFEQWVPCGRGGQLGLRLPKFRWPAPPLPGCVALDRLLMSLCFRFPVCRMGITLYGPLRAVSEALQVQSSAQCLTQSMYPRNVRYHFQYHVLLVIRALHLLPPNPRPKVHTHHGGRAEGEKLGLALPPSPPAAQAVLHPCSSESPDK